MAIKTYEKHPLAQLDYGYDLTRWLTGIETVVTVNATLVSGDVTLGATITDGKRMGVMVLGGTDRTKSVIDIVGITDSVPSRRFARRFEVAVSNKVGQMKPGQV